MQSPAASLRRALERIDGRGYRAYQDLRGAYLFDTLSLHIDHVQGDPFAAPSRVRLRVPAPFAEFPTEYFGDRDRRIALEDFLGRAVRRAIRNRDPRRSGSGKSGHVSIDAGGQDVLERTAVVVHAEFVEARIEVGLPAAGRRVLGRAAEELLCDDLPAIAEESLRFQNLDGAALKRFIECVENQARIRGALRERGLVAFIADGSILPRESGISERPLQGDDSTPFRSPESMRVHFDLANPLPDGRTSLSGMGVPRGVSLIVGGGYHGKSTLLRAIERGVYSKIPDDGREYVVSDSDLVKVRAEDGRRVECVDISPFISNLPHGRSTRAFSSDDASGSTSQAANIVEALEIGASGLLLDEDTCATNFMVRDARMQALVAKKQEPITPFLDRVRSLYEDRGVSTVLVMGGCGDYFEVADRVIRMCEYVPEEVTEQARSIAATHVSGRAIEDESEFAPPTGRIPVPTSFDSSRGRRDVKIDAPRLDHIRYGSDDIDLRGLEQIVDRSQTRAIGYAIHFASQKWMGADVELQQIAAKLDPFFDDCGLDALDPFHRPGNHPGNLARPRRFEVAAAINRLRSVRMESAK